jgi:hypothetical protein
MSCSIPEQRNHLTWSIGAALTSYALVAGLSRRGSYTIPLPAGQLNLGMAIGGVAGFFAMVGQQWMESRAVLSHLRKLRERIDAHQISTNVVDTEWSTIDLSSEMLLQAEADNDRAYECYEGRMSGLLGIEQEVKTSEPEGEDLFDWEREAAPTASNPERLQPANESGSFSHRKIEYSQIERWKAIGVGCLIGSVGSTLVAKIGQGGRYFGQWSVCSRRWVCSLFRHMVCRFNIDALSGSRGPQKGGQDSKTGWGIPSTGERAVAAG